MNGLEQTETQVVETVAPVKRGRKPNENRLMTIRINGEGVPATRGKPSTATAYRVVKVKFHNYTHGAVVKPEDIVEVVKEIPAVVPAVVA